MGFFSRLMLLIQYAVMLSHTFLHIPQVGAITEQKIWVAGVCSAEAFMHSPPAFLGAAKASMITGQLRLSQQMLRAGNSQYFYGALSAGEHWRMFKEFQGSVAYLDIETSGFSAPQDIITTIALYDGKNIKYYVYGHNLEKFKHDIQQYQVLVTYNGKTFDVPFIERFLGINMPQAHIDLRYVLRSLGYAGGLKSCERQLGINRGGALADVDGFFAVLLWQDYTQNGSRKALETLLSYNIADVLNLEHLMVIAYNKKLATLPFPAARLSLPVTPANPFKVDENTVRRIQSARWFA